MASYEVQLASYILGKFYLGTDIKYKCTNTKLQKLLIIAQFRKIYVTQRQLFDANIMVNPCGFGIRSVAGFFPIDICGTVETTPDDKNRRIDPASIHEAPELGELYDGGMRFVESGDIDWIRNAFCRFGSYSAKELSDMMNRMSLHRTDRMQLDVNYLVNILKRTIDQDCKESNEIVRYVSLGY